MWTLFTLAESYYQGIKFTRTDKFQTILGILSHSVCGPFNIREACIDFPSRPVDASVNSLNVYWWF